VCHLDLRASVDVSGRCRGRRWIAEQQSHDGLHCNARVLPTTLFISINAAFIVNATIPAQFRDGSTCNNKDMRAVGADILFADRYTRVRRIAETRLRAY